MHAFNTQTPADVKTIYGIPLQTQLGRWSLTCLALLGHGLRTGTVAMTLLTPRQTVAVIPRITMADLRSVRNATPLEYAAMKRGAFTVEALHKEQLGNRRRLSDAALKKIMVEQGLDRVLAMLDELTVPSKTNGHAVPANDNGNGVTMPEQLSL
jgi:hypothetical protein